MHALRSRLICSRPVLRVPAGTVTQQPQLHSRRLLAAPAEQHQLGLLSDMDAPPTRRSPAELEMMDGIEGRILQQVGRLLSGRHKSQQECTRVLTDLEAVAVAAPVNVCWSRGELPNPVLPAFKWWWGGAGAAVLGSNWWHDWQCHASSA
jgi:hypothetical protein